ncbi:MAG: polyphosphate kinase 2 family protein [Planctomycetota bacterium]|nr:MAG: polyphosphate kinase 2 family protein [Planctomycetota bacterium]
MFAAPPSPYLVPFDGSFRVDDAPTAPPEDAPDRKRCEKKLEKTVKELRRLQRKLYAQDQYALLLVFQAMDAAGKDSTIRAVMTGINPAGCQVYSFKRPSTEEYDHDFLWRTAVRLPERGRIGIFNRSYYESVLVVRVHPEFLRAERIPDAPPLERLWRERYESIADHEKHLARNGTVILKFFLNVSREEQKRRFLSRIDEPDKNWKFSRHDLEERALWPRYMEAYEDALNATSRPHAPWYAIPADDKPFMRLTVARLVADALDGLGLAYPTLDPEEQARLGECRARLLAEE